MAMTDMNQKVSRASSSETSMMDPAAVAKLLPKKDNVTGKIKIKKPSSKLRVEISDSQPTGTPRSASPDSPLVNELDPDLRATFPTGRPTEDKADLIQCKHCKKPMLKSVAAPHMRLCLQKKKEREQKKKEQKEAARKAREAREKGKEAAAAAAVGGSDVEDTNAGNGAKDGAGAGAGDADELHGGTKTANTSAGQGTDKSKKRKAEAGAEGEKEPKKKKTKKEIEAAKVKVAKPKGPVDVEKQCGVLLANGAYCARSLTCKSHAMGAKRAVPGRSLPYDMLLQAYQKKNQAKQQKAAFDATAPLADDFEASGPVDSDEEKDLVMAAIARSRPRPMDQHIFVPLRKKYAFVRMKEMLSNALGGNRGGGLFGGAHNMPAPPPMMTGAGTGQAEGDGNTGGEAAAAADAARRASVASQGGRAGPPGPLAMPMRKASVGEAAAAG